MSRLPPDLAELSQSLLRYLSSGMLTQPDDWQSLWAFSRQPRAEGHWYHLEIKCSEPRKLNVKSELSQLYKYYVLLACEVLPSQT